MTLAELKSRADKLYADISRCCRRDEEWTSPRGVGTNAHEAIEAAIAFKELIDDIDDEDVE